MDYGRGVVGCVRHLMDHATLLGLGTHFTIVLSECYISQLTTTSSTDEHVRVKWGKSHRLAPGWIRIAIQLILRPSKCYRHTLAMASC